MRIFDGKVYRDMTAEELAARADERARFEAAEKKRPLTAEEVNRMLITEQINTLAVDDQTALRMIDFYPEWAAGVSYPVGHKVRYVGKLYKVISAHTSQADWTPDATASLFTVINEEHDGSKYDPIPYDGNMALEADKYYIQDGVTYLCTRGTVNPVYNPLAELVGVYVEEGAVT